MQIPEQALLLRIFIGESDTHQGRPLYEAIVLKARELHLAGATVLRGPMGYGRSSRLHTAKILRLSEDLPLVIEIVDSVEKDPGLSSRPGRHDRERPGHAGEGPGAPLRRSADLRHLKNPFPPQDRSIGIRTALAIGPTDDCPDYSVRVWLQIRFLGFELLPR